MDILVLFPAKKITGGQVSMYYYHHHSCFYHADGVCILQSADRIGFPAPDGACAQSKSDLNLCPEQIRLTRLYSRRQARPGSLPQCSARESDSNPKTR